MSADGGETWNKQSAENQFFLNKLLRASGSAWALGPFGMVKQTGTGTQWKRIVNPLSGGAESDNK